jgi:hypothetical protein
MAVYDWAKANREQEEEKAYVRFKESLSLKDKDGYVNEHYLVLNHLHRMEGLIEKQQKELNEYRSFFLALRNFLPKEFTVNDIIG